MVLAADTAKGIPLQASPITLSGSYGDWSYRCSFPAGNPASGPQNCLVQQTLMTPGQNGQQASPLGMVILARSTDDTVKSPLSGRPWRLTVMAPLGLSLKTAPRLSSDGHKAMALEWQSCVVTGCLASLDLASNQASVIKGSKQGHFEADKIVGGTLSINFSLEGVEPAMKHVDEWVNHSPLR
ncbi:invasion associated locus B family protein [Acetobacteraceae bacterium ESL0709]|nr:invasion associated locus B family protein [Acetobacteraceae bacterium ESL0697]MDF7678058.1 invasion associated locus B family protein [Acetobacteraceae bacterium ESL0709]